MCTKNYRKSTSASWYVRKINQPHVGWYLTLLYIYAIYGVGRTPHTPTHLLPTKLLCSRISIHTSLRARFSTTPRLSVIILTLSKVGIEIRCIKWLKLKIKNLTFNLNFWIKKKKNQKSKKIKYYKSEKNIVKQKKEIAVI